MPRHQRHREQQLLLDQVAQRDPPVFHHHRLDARVEPVSRVEIRDQSDPGVGAHLDADGPEAPLAHERQHRLNRDNRNRLTPLTRNCHMPHGTPGGVGKFAGQTGKHVEGSVEIDTLSGVGEPLDINRARPVRRHGARIIGATAGRVKAGISPKLLFL